MSIPIKEGSTKRDWLKMVGATAEAAFKSLTLGKDGFSAAASPLFRLFEALRGIDSTERRATRLVLETLSYSIAKTITSIQLTRAPLQPELETIVEHLLARVQTLAEQNSILLDASHLENPGSFRLFDDVAVRLYHELKPNEPKAREADVVAIFQASIVDGLNRVRTRNAEYYAPIFELLSGPNARGDAKVRAWETYRELLVKRFEDEPLFGEDKSVGVTLGQIYQHLRASWDDREDEADVQVTSKKPAKILRHIRMLDDLILEWLSEDNVADRIRLVSGGPGSGKSTFAKHLAAALSTQQQWRVVFVPLQRLRGTGPLEGRIDDYFRLQTDEPFGADTVPLHSMGRDGHHHWLLIFDGLDELAKEGPGSESAAQDFATALADMRGRIGGAAVRFLVLGRAPSMQEARRRLGLHGKGTIHVAGMAPFSKAHSGDAEKISFEDPLKLREKDQRPEFWSRWAVAKDLPLSPPEAMQAEELLDLTNEPLLAYLLILSGYVSDRWQEAAENRNRIYQAIFNQIWEREKAKPTRLYLNDLGQDGFESLLQALGIAAWRGGGRTGDEFTFISVRDVFMRPDLLASAKSCGAADLSNVALLFYTRKDEEGGRGYEFLHKSFGEYLTARGLFNSFLRWGGQVNDPTLDFDVKEFLRRWLKLTGPAPITREILVFLRNEVRLHSGNTDKSRAWEAARRLVPIVEQLADAAVRDGLPAHEAANRWRSAEADERNGEIALFALVDSLARAAYPIELLGLSQAEGGWSPGPIRISELARQYGLAIFLQRVMDPTSIGWFGGPYFFGRHHSSLFSSLLSRLDLRGIPIVGQQFSGFDFEGANFSGAQFVASTVINSRFKGATLVGARIQYSRFVQADFTDTDMTDVEWHHTYVDELSLKSSNLKPQLRKHLAKMRKTYISNST